jgi:hypothetical protein
VWQATGLDGDTPFCIEHHAPEATAFGAASLPVGLALWLAEWPDVWGLMQAL